MPKLIDFKIKIQTGDRGTDGQVCFSVNNHTVPFENTKGSGESGEVFEGDFQVNSYAHSLSLVGPESGKWDIKEISVDYNCEGTEPYKVRLGEVTLDGTNEVNIWRDPPLPTFDV